MYEMEFTAFDLKKLVHTTNKIPTLKQSIISNTPYMYRQQSAILTDSDKTKDITQEAKLIVVSLSIE